MMAFESIRIGALRGLRELEISGCQRINIIVGANNSGKTSILEALLLLSDPTDLGRWEAAVDLRRGWPLVERRPVDGGLDRLQAFTWLFPQVNGEKPRIVLEAKGASPVKALDAVVEHISGTPPERPVDSTHELIESTFRRSFRGESVSDDPVPGLSIEMALRRVTTQPSLFPDRNSFRMVLWQGGARRRYEQNTENIRAVFATPVSHRSDGYQSRSVSSLVRKRKKDWAINLLSKLDPNISDLVLVTAEPQEGDRLGVPYRPGVPSLHVEYGRAGLVPVHAMGDGIRRAIHFAGLLAEAGPGGVLFIDEVESAMHVTVLTDTFRWLAEAASNKDVQVFVTTHSLEAVDAMVKSVPGPDIALFRLGTGRVRRYDGPLLRTARGELGLEVR